MSQALKKTCRSPFFINPKHAWGEAAETAHSLGFRSAVLE